MTKCYLENAHPEREDKSGVLVGDRVSSASIVSHTLWVGILGDDVETRFVVGI